MIYAVIGFFIYMFFGVSFGSIWDIREAHKKGDIDGQGYSIFKLYLISFLWPLYQFSKHYL